MPELPEVETVRRDLAARLLNKKISEVVVKSNKTVGEAVAFFKVALQNSSFSDIKRRGKLLIFILKNKKQILLVHLKMTGQLIYIAGQIVSVGGHSLGTGSLAKAVGGTLPNRHTRVIITFADKSVLYFNDLRKFGYMKIVAAADLPKILADNYGLEPLDKNFSGEYLYEQLQRRRVAVKTALLNQKMLAGLGNIYVDEVLFASGLRPDRPANKIKRREADLIALHSRRILTAAISKRGTTFSNYVDGQGKVGNYSQSLQVYGRQGEKCLQCGRPIIKTKINGRGTHYCAFCQK
jgi:formamidopyrimidine-DNA glycosylase